MIPPDSTNQSDGVEALRDLFDDVDDIANKPWRAIRALKESFAAHYSGDEDYKQECVRELTKLEAFYSNDGRSYIDSFLKSKTTNLNWPSYWEDSPTKSTKEDL